MFCLSKAAACSHGTGCGVARLQQAQLQEPGKHSQIHTCDKELGARTHSGYVIQISVFPRGWLHTHNSFGEATKCLCLSNAAWRKHGPCTSRDHTKARSVTRVKRKWACNNEKISLKLSCLNLFRLKLCFYRSNRTFGGFFSWKNASVCYDSLLADGLVMKYK